MTVVPYRSPVTVLDAQLDLIGWWRSAQGDRWRRVVGEKMLGAVGWPVGVEQIMATIPEMLGGWTCWVGPDVVQLVEQAAQSVPAPDGVIGAGMIPQPAGMIWIAGDPIDFGVLAYDETAFVRAVSWAPAMIPTPEGSAPGVVVAVWLQGDNQVRPAMVGSMPLSRAAAQMLDDPGEVWPSAPFDRVWGDDTVEACAYRWLCAAWVLVAEVLPSHTVWAPRAARRRAGRLLGPVPPEWGEVHVSTLRQMHHGESDPAGGYDPHYSHRWVVRGHWRWQACGEGRRDRRLIWIAPHVKGPDGAPLVEVEQVAKLVR